MKLAEKEKILKNLNNRELFVESSEEESFKRQQIKNKRELIDGLSLTKKPETNKQIKYLSFGFFVLILLIAIYMSLKG